MKPMLMSSMLALASASLWTGCLEPADESADPMTPVVSRVLSISESYWDDTPETTATAYSYDSRGYPVRAVEEGGAVLEFDSKGRYLGGHAAGSSSYQITISWFGMDSARVVYPPDPYDNDNEVQVRRFKLFGFPSKFWPRDFLADSIRVYADGGEYAYTYGYLLDAEGYPVVKFRNRSPLASDTSELYQNTYDSEGRLVTVAVLEPTIDGPQIQETLKLEYDLLKNVRVAR